MTAALIEALKSGARAKPETINFVADLQISILAEFHTSTYVVHGSTINRQPHHGHRESGGGGDVSGGPVTERRNRVYKAVPYLTVSAFVALFSVGAKHVDTSSNNPLAFIVGSWNSECGSGGCDTEETLEDWEDYSEECMQERCSTEELTELAGGTAAITPMLVNYLFCALAGTTWYFQFFFYTMGETQMGAYKFSSWTMHMASIIIFSTLWGIGLHEWRGASFKTKRLLTASLAVLVLSTMVVGYGNYLGQPPAAATTAAR